MNEVVVYVVIQLREERVERVHELAQEFVDEVNREPGCITYELSWDVGDPTVLRLIEHWESAEAYEVHRRQAHVAQWGATMLEAQATPAVARKFLAAAYPS